MPKSTTFNNTPGAAIKSLEELIQAPPKPNNDVELMKLRAKPANPRQSRGTVCPTDGSWTEWQVYGSPTILEGSTSDTSGGPKRIARKWTPRIRSRLNEDGSLDIVFLYRGR